METHQDAFDPAELDGALGIRSLLSRGLLSGRELVPVGEAILKRLLWAKGEGPVRTSGPHCHDSSDITLLDGQAAGRGDLWCALTETENTHSIIHPQI